MKVLKFVVGDNNNEQFCKAGLHVVSDKEAELICNPHLDNDVTYNKFCDNVVPREIDNCPYNWYFIESPKVVG